MRVDLLEQVQDAIDLQAIIQADEEELLNLLKAELETDISGKDYFLNKTCSKLFAF